MDKLSPAHGVHLTLSLLTVIDRLEYRGGHHDSCDAFCKCCEGDSRSSLNSISHPARGYRLLLSRQLLIQRDQLSEVSLSSVICERHGFYAMQISTPDPVRYDAVTVAFHWATAVMVIPQWLDAQVIDWFPRGSMRVDTRSVHIVTGVLLSVLLLARVTWRVTGGRRLPPAGQGKFSIVAKGTHWLLYVLLAAMLLVGIFLAWVRGDSIFGLFSIPTYDPLDGKLREQVQNVHAIIGWSIVAFVVLHASAALVHRYVWHDSVLDRMLIKLPNRYPDGADRL